MKDESNSGAPGPSTGHAPPDREGSPAATGVPASDVTQALAGYRRIVVITDGYSTPFLAKTAISLLRYRGGDVAAVLDSQADAADAGSLFGVDVDVPVIGDLSQVQDADALFIGIAPPGGRVPEAWRPILAQAVREGLDVVSGLHDFLTDDPALVGLAKTYGRRLIDVRRNAWKQTAECHPFRPGCFRVHTVGHDCTVGKMVVSLEIQRELSRRGEDAAFLATGQTGIMISGKGVPADCVVSDFINGAVERLVRDNEHHEFLLVEGQGSISHPAFSAVTLGLLHGAAPHGLVYCYEAGRDFVKGLGDVPIPPHESLIEALETVANLRHPCRVIGVAVNTRTLSPADASAEVRRASDTLGLPACDVYRDGAGVLADAVLALRDRATVPDGSRVPEGSR